MATAVGEPPPYSGGGDRRRASPRGPGRTPRCARGPWRLRAHATWPCQGRRAASTGAQGARAPPTGLDDREPGRRRRASPDRARRAPRACSRRRGARRSAPARLFLDPRSRTQYTAGPRTRILPPAATARKKRPFLPPSPFQKGYSHLSLVPRSTLRSVLSKPVAALGICQLRRGPTPSGPLDSFAGENKDRTSAKKRGTVSRCFLRARGCPLRELLQLGRFVKLQARHDGQIVAPDYRRLGRFNGLGFGEFREFLTHSV